VPVFRNIVFAAAAAGLLAGVLVTVAQQMGVVPLILAAEVFEQAPEPTAAAAPAEHGHGDHEKAWAPQEGFERTAFTLLANVVTGAGFALLLVAGFALRGGAMDWREGLRWGLAGFAVFMLVPSIGLPPELPGMPAASLGPRQLWWAMTAAATAAAFALLAFRGSPLWSAAAVVLLLAPHLIGAPQPPDEGTLVPASLHQRFVVAVTVTSFLFWIALGVLSAVFFGRFSRGPALAAAPRSGAASA
jgi:cobalt transporter subunit CbtA